MTQSPFIDYDRVADLYDEYVHVGFDVPFFLDAARQAAGDVLELMSGTGRVSLPLVEAGVRLTCVDRSAEMLAVLRQKLEQRRLAAEVYQMDVRELSLPRQYSLAFIPFHSLAELVSAEDRRQTLGRIHAHLAPGGRLIITLACCAPGVRDKPVHDLDAAKNPRIIIVRCQYVRTRLLERNPKRRHYGARGQPRRFDRQVNRHSQVF